MNSTLADCYHHHGSESVMITDEESSSTTASYYDNVVGAFKPWQREPVVDEYTDSDEDDDEQLAHCPPSGDPFRNHDIFTLPPVFVNLPTVPLEEELVLSMDLEDDDHHQGQPPHDKTSSLPFQERYTATLEKLRDCMKRSQETRKSLQMTTEDYNRNTSVTGVLTSIEKSTKQLQQIYSPKDSMEQ